MQAIQMSSLRIGKLLLLIGSAAFVLTALAHLSCIHFGPQCYATQMAPEVIVESAKANTLLAPLATIGVAIIFLVLAGFGLSAAKSIPRLPMLTTGIYTIAVVCIIRGLLPLQLWIRHPHKVNDIVFYVGVAWLVTGLFYGIGYRLLKEEN